MAASNPQRPSSSTGRPQQGGQARLIASLVLIVVVVVFTLQNVEPVRVTLLVWSVTLSRALLIFVVLAIGILIGWILRGLQQRRPTR